MQSAIPKFEEGGILQSLTLTTPELRAERERIDAEEKRKKEIRNMLAGMLPWQTQDPDRDILVEECREAILQLSKSKETFFGPFPLPPMKAKSGDDDEDHTKQTTVPSKDSLEKLAKLQPLPPLLENFEFLAHVGLIEKILAEDPNLVEMQSTLSGMYFCIILSSSLEVVQYESSNHLLVESLQAGVLENEFFGTITFFTVLIRDTKRGSLLMKFGQRRPACRYLYLQRRSLPLLMVSM